MEKIALILGSNGAFGSAMASELATRGWVIRRFKRGEDMAHAAMGVSTIVNGLNPPNYHNWADILPRITADVLRAARASGAKVLLPGNVYPYGKQPGPWGAKTPHLPCSRKGAIRARVEADYKAHAAAGGSVLILRAGDFLGPNPALAYNTVILKSIAKNKVSILGNGDARRAWAYLPDMARAAADLLEKPDLPQFLDVPFAGFNLSQNELIATIEAQLKASVKVSHFPEWALPILSPVWELARELREMMYLWHEAHSLSRTDLAAYLPDFAPTPVATVVKEMLSAKGR